MHHHLAKDMSTMQSDQMVQKKIVGITINAPHTSEIIL